VVEIAEGGESLLDDLMTRDTGQGGDECDPTGVMLMCAVVKALERRAVPLDMRVHLDSRGWQSVRGPGLLPWDVLGPDRR
jgi:hypothetical protein